LETKPGFKTTEFIGYVVTLVTIFASALGEALPPKWAALAGAIATAGYAIARGLAKLGIAPEEVVPARPPTTVTK
jgi:hypothetical protein